jgi:hypothetical protein
MQLDVRLCMEWIQLSLMQRINIAALLKNFFDFYGFRLRFWKIPCRGMAWLPLKIFAFAEKGLGCQSKTLLQFQQF